MEQEDFSTGVRLLIDLGFHLFGGGHPFNLLDGIATCADTVQILLEAGAEPNLYGNCHRAPLAQAAMNGREDVTSLLIQFGANPNGNESEDTPLREACFQGRVNIVRMLIEAGADVNDAFYQAYRRGIGEIMVMLLEAGVDLEGVFKRDDIYSLEKFLQIPEMAKYITDNINLLSPANRKRWNEYRLRVLFH